MFDDDDDDVDNLDDDEAEVMEVEFARKAHQGDLGGVLIHAGPRASNHLSSVADKYKCK